MGARMSELDDEDRRALARLAKEVLADERPGVRSRLSAKKLLEFAERKMLGKYIRVDEYPLDRDKVDDLISRVVQWRWSEERLPQIKDEAMWRIGHYEFQPGDPACAQAVQLSEKATFTPDDIVRLPLKGCRELCACEWRWRRRNRTA